jgi:heat shock protein HtpX
MFEQIRSNRRRSAAVVAGMTLILAAAGAGLGLALGGSREGATVGVAAAGALVLLLWLVATAGGDRLLLGIAGARRIEKQHHPRLFNVVEEMSIAAALPAMPEVYVVEEEAPNAFATGRGRRSAVAVTTGLLARLDRDELQGVVAHEIGHIKNRDVRLMTVAGILLGSVVLLGEAARRIAFLGRARSRRSSGKSGGAEALVLVVALLVAILAPLFARLLYFALSRRREYLADAAGALYTRYPEGLARALEKIASFAGRPADRSLVTAPMYIHQPKLEGSGLSGLLSTHPPIETRIRILRAMGGQAGLDAYARAAAASGRPGLIGRRSLLEAQAVPARGPEAEPPHPGQRREALDAVFLAEGWRIATCPCGARLRVPPRSSEPVERCPRCDRPFAAAG